MGAWRSAQKEAVLRAEGWSPGVVPKRGASGRIRVAWASPDGALTLPLPEAYRHAKHPVPPKGMVKIRRRAFRGTPQVSIKALLMGAIRAAFQTRKASAKDEAPVDKEA